MISYGIEKHLTHEKKEELKIILLCNEAYKTSEVEGEILDRDSIQSSIKRYFGIKESHHKQPRESGIAEMMVNLYTTFSEPLSHETLFLWHAMLMNGRRDLQNIGAYRTHDEPVQIVSGAVYAPTIHYEAPPSCKIKEEMDHFIKWFNDEKSLKEHPLTRASITHLYFESIHPFEDGNGRIGRALVEKILAQYHKKPILLALSTVIQDQKKTYYDRLHEFSTTLHITEWISYFCHVLLEAQKMTVMEMAFLIEKTHFLNKYDAVMNERQKRVVDRILKEGMKEFKGGLSAHNYQKITGTSSATATRDLKEMVEKNILRKTGERKHTRYFLNFHISYETRKEQS